MNPNLAVFVAAATLFVALATAILGLFAWLRADLRRLEARMAAMEHGQAKLEGCLKACARQSPAGSTAPPPNSLPAFQPAGRGAASY